MSSTYAHIKGEVVVSAQLVGKPGTGKELVQWADKLKANVDANEPGTLEYTFGKSGDTLVVFERYANVDALEAHINSAIMREFISANILAKSPTLLFYENIHA